MEFMECLNKDAKKKKGHFLYIVGKAILIATVAKLLGTKYEFYGFNNDLMIPLTDLDIGMLAML